MNEWNDPSAKLPAEGEQVEVRLPGGRRVKPVEFSAGRFWKVRKGSGGHAYMVDGWRSLEAPKKGRTLTGSDTAYATPGTSNDLPES